MTLALELGQVSDPSARRALEQVSLNWPTLAQGVTLVERAAPPAPGANQAIVYARDNGAGKTQVCVLFPTGAPLVLATEP